MELTGAQPAQNAKGKDFVTLMAGALARRIGVHSLTPAKSKRLLTLMRSQHVLKIEIVEVIEHAISRMYVKASVVALLKSNALLMKVEALLEMEIVNLNSSVRV